MGYLAEKLALACGENAITARQIGRAAALHDVGKILVPSHIVQKPGRLTSREFEVMKTHTTWGALLLSGLKGSFGVLAREIALFHHERWSGDGYYKIPAAKLPLSVQMVSICDVYVSLVSPRPYKNAWPQSKAARYIRAQAGTQFNPVLADIFLSLMSGKTQFYGRDFIEYI